MAIELERRELRSIELRKKKMKQRITILIFLGSLIGIIIGTFIIKQILDRDYVSFQVLHTTKRKDSSQAQYVGYRGGVIRYSRDGAMAMDSTGNMIWNGAYEMTNPIIDITDQYAVIADRGYKTIEIFNGKSKLPTLNMLSPIMKVEVANQGVVAVLMDDSDTNRIELYSEEGTHLAGIRTINQKDGYPVDISLSNDGRKLVTSYISFNKGVVQNKVTFYNFGSVGKNYIDKLVGYFDFENTIVPSIEFVNNDTVVAFGDNRFSIFSVKEVPSLKFEKSFESEIKSICYNETYVGVVLNNFEGEYNNQVIIYDLDGNLLMDKKTNFVYNRIVLSGDELIMSSDTECLIFKVNGEKKFEYKFDRNINYLFSVNNEDKYILIDDINMEEIQLIE